MSEFFSKEPSDVGFEQLERTAARIRMQAVDSASVDRFVASLLRHEPRVTPTDTRQKAAIPSSILAVAAVLMLSATLLLTPFSGTQSLFAQVQAEVSRTRTA